METVLGYYVDGALVDAAEIQHRKANVDANVKRGLPLFYPVRKNLRRAEKLLRNMSVVAEIQSAIAIIRKHGSGTREQRRAVRPGPGRRAPSPARPPAARATSAATPRARSSTPSPAPTTSSPPAAIDAGRFVAVLQAELRAIASRLVMPEFMLTSDATNANYASTMVAEGPAVKMFQRLQHEMIEDDLEVMDRVIAAAVDAGRLPPEALAAVDIQAIPPTLAVRDRLREAQADQILVRNRAMSDPNPGHPPRPGRGEGAAVDWIAGGADFRVRTGGQPGLVFLAKSPAEEAVQDRRHEFTLTGECQNRSLLLPCGRLKTRRVAPLERTEAVPSCRYDILQKSEVR